MPETVPDARRDQVTRVRATGQSRLRFDERHPAVTYDAFGNLTSDSAPAAESLFLFTARPYDADAQLQNNLNRWYDPATGRWISTDPIGFEAVR